MSMTTLPLTLALTLVLSTSLLLWSDCAAANTRTFEFDVFLDGEPMGTHRYTLSMSGERVKVVSEASYTVKVLFVTAWRYKHRSEEEWLQGCLRAIDSITDENGREFHVNGEATADGLELETQDGPQIHPGCVRSFAYWHPDLHESTTLMNAQTGKVEPVTMETLPSRPAPRQSNTTGGKVFGIRGKDIHIDVWHGESGTWYGLSSRTAEGRLIEYLLRGTTAESSKH